MLAAKDEYINEASNTIFQLSAEEQICKRCRDREEYYLDMRAHERELENRNKQLRALLKEHGIDIPLQDKK